MVRERGRAQISRESSLDRGVVEESPTSKWLLHRMLKVTESVVLLAASATYQWLTGTHAAMFHVSTLGTNDFAGLGRGELAPCRLMLQGR